MAWSVYDETSPGMPNLLSVNGSGTTLLRTVLPLLGWAVEYGPTGNAAVFRAAAGNRHRLQVRHESSLSGDAALGMVRGAHTATSATAVGSPFPNATQAPNNQATWKFGIPGDPSTPARWKIAGDDRFFHFFSHDPSYGWDWQYFGDVPSDYSTGYETVCSSRYSSGSPYGSTGLGETLYPYPQAMNLAWARGINGTTISTYGCKDGRQHPPGRVGNTPAMRGGYQNRVMREKIGVTCIGSSSTTPNVLGLIRRGWLPNVWAPIHSQIGGVSDGDTFTDSAYDPAANFLVVDSPSYGSLILETTDTWVKP